MAFGLTVGRVVAYLLTVLAAVAGVLSQFPTTRPLLSQIATEGTQPLVRGAQAALGAIPGLLLATTLVIAVIAGLRVLHIVIDRAAAQRAGLRGIAPRRLPALRSALAAGIVLVFAPLVVAAMFGRFGTPIETLAVAAGVVALAASLPVLASSAAGAAIIWRQSLQEGDWIEVADLRGEVTQVNLHDIHLVPEQGGIAVIPTVFLLFHPIRKMREAPPATFEIEVARSRPPIELLARVTGAVKEVLPEAQLEIVELKTGALHLRLTVRGLRPDAKQRLFSSLAEAIERGDFELSLRATDSAS
jgi:small-conductance mechanosensitive channel